MGVFAGISVLIGAFGDLTSLVLGLALGAVAWNEIRGGKLVRGFDPRGITVLVWNQLFIGIVIVAYGAMQLVAAMHTTGLGGQTTGDPGMDEMVTSLTRTIGTAFYGMVMVVGAAGPGLMALYYRSRGRMVRAYLESTPHWVVRTMRATG